MIQAEKFSPAEIAALVKRMASMAYTRARPIIAAAGGVNAANAAAYAQAGADVLVTSSPYLAKPRDVQVQIAATEADRPRARLGPRKDAIAPALT
ncbi:nicotinate-nucleotide pyrophosphorylase [Bradyrhizobium sp. USDA 326]